VIIAASAASSKRYIKIFSLLFILFLSQSFLTNYKLLTNPELAKLPRGERSGYLEEWTAGQGIKEISEYIKNEHENEPGVQVITGTEGYFGTLPDGLEMYLEGVPNVVTIGVGLGHSNLPTSLRESKDAGNKTYFVINKSRLIETPENLGLKLIAAYPKALRYEGSREYNLMGPQEVLYFFEVE
jgi:hypothetical protein